jgi:hypothetical protein
MEGRQEKGGNRKRIQKKGNQNGERRKHRIGGVNSAPCKCLQQAGA